MDFMKDSDVSMFTSELLFFFEKCKCNNAAGQLYKHVLFFPSFVTNAIIWTITVFEIFKNMSF